MRLVLSLMFAGLVAACASPYKPDLHSRPTARIRFVTEHPASVHGIEATMVNYHPQSCSPPAGNNTIDSRSEAIALLTGNASLGTPFFAAQQPKDAMTRLGMPGDVPAKESLYAEKAVPAGRPFPFSMRTSYRTGWNTMAVCAIGVEFLPESEGDYEAVYVQSGNGCAINVFRLARSGATVQKVPLRVAKLRACS